jgi:hypothetical protein
VGLVGDRPNPLRPASAPSSQEEEETEDEEEEEEKEDIAAEAVDDPISECESSS